MTKKSVFSLLVCVTAAGMVVAQENKEPPSAIRQFPNLKTMPDSSPGLQKQIDQNRGSLVLKSGVYRLTKTLEIDLTKHGAVLVKADKGGVTFIMDGPGPAFLLRGSHEGTASPKSFKVKTWRERMPIVQGIEIVGNHPDAVGIELIQTMEPVLTRVSV
ncbi:MAG: hypothetical protein HKN23_17065, partial [Verrucomicrobiales bacterium]|nr:hypothetical protein [Verrucomicrobiales bacterium]